MAENKTRQNIPQDPLNPVPHVNSGYENAPSLDFTIPPCGIQDIDYAMHRLFKTDIGFQAHSIQTQMGAQNINKPQVIFASGERFATVKKLNPPRDKQKALILPAISIRRTSVTQASDDLISRGMNQFSGNITIKRRLSEEDRNYQNLRNKQGLQNLQNVLSGLPTTLNETGALSSQAEIVQGGLLESTLDNDNIYEIISIPQPQFFTATYEVIFWTGYLQHMNYMIETFMSSFLPHGRTHKLTTDKGYWFIAYTQDTVNNSSNIEDFGDTERVIQYTLSMNVKGYLLAPQHPTNMVPVRRWLSCPTVVFDTYATTSEVQPKSHMEKPPINYGSESKFILSDINEDPNSSPPKSTLQKYLMKKTVVDPTTGKRRTKYVSILSSNQAKGETAYTASDLESLDQYILSPNKR